MAKKTTTHSLDYTNLSKENEQTFVNLFSKIKPDITLEEAIEAHKVLFSDYTKPVIEEDDIRNYFNKL